MNMGRRRISAILLCLLVLPASQRAEGSAKAPQTRPTRLPRPVPQIERAILISIDGGRPDLLLRANMPNIRRLMDSGSYTFWATTVPVAITLPAHASMITGVLPERHGVTWNNKVPEDAELARPKVPTIFEIAMRYGLTTAVVAGKSKFDTFARVGYADRAWTRSVDDAKVADAAVTMLRDYRPDLMLVHFPGADKAGHNIGWASAAQIAVLEDIDEQIGKVLDALDDQRLRDKTVILVTADHGGQGRGHGIANGGLASADDPRSQHIPWVLSGPGIRKNYDLSQDPRLHVRTMDSFATLCHLLGLEPNGPIDGKPVTSAIEAPGQLLQDAK